MTPLKPSPLSKKASIFKKAIAIKYAFLLLSLQSALGNDISGRWSPDCDALNGIVIKQDLTSRLEVNSNQIHISARLIPSGERFALLLQEPLDLGRGGLQLDWNNYSKEVAIAELKPNQDGSLNFLWNGFYDSRKKAFTWIKEPDFVRENTDFYRCSDE